MKRRSVVLELARIDRRLSRIERTLRARADDPVARSGGPADRDPRKATFRRFADEALKSDPTGTVSGQAFMESYRRFCSIVGGEALGPRHAGQMLRRVCSERAIPLHRRHCRSVDGRRGWSYCGIAVVLE